MFSRDPIKKMFDRAHTETASFERHMRRAAKCATERVRILAEINEKPEFRAQVSPEQLVILDAQTKESVEGLKVLSSFMQKVK